MKKVFVVVLVAVVFLTIASAAMARSEKQIVAYTVTLTKAQTESDPAIDMIQDQAEAAFPDLSVSTGYDLITYKVPGQKGKASKIKVRSIVITLSTEPYDNQDDPVTYFTQEQVDATIDAAEETFPGYSVAVSYKKKNVK